MPGESRASPTKSRRVRFDVATSPGGSLRYASQAPMSPNGRLNKNSQRHDSRWITSPPSTGPSTGATSTGTDMMLTARPMRLGPASWAMSAYVSGASSPATAPCSTRNAIKLGADKASAHSAEVPVKPSRQVT